MTCRCDWRIADLIADIHPTTLYLVVPPSDISRTKPLIRLVLNQIGRRLTEDGGIRHQEFPDRAVTQSDREGLRAQKCHSRQLHVRVSFATNDERTAKRVSDALGTPPSALVRPFP